MMKTVRGFTIVELLIVIVIIGILAAITIVAYNGMQQRTRDAIRIKDLKDVAKAVELYKVDNGTYPLSANGSGNWAGTCPNGGSHAEYIAGLSPSYMQRLPIEPRYNVAGQCYYYRSNGTDYMFMAHGTMETVCGSDASDGCNSAQIRSMDRACCTQFTIGVWSPGGAGW
jgi:type II secretion system protein G